jgi:hypothetical protein
MAVSDVSLDRDCVTEEPLTILEIAIFGTISLFPEENLCFKNILLHYIVQTKG